MSTRLSMAGERVNYLSIALRARGAIKTLKSLMALRQGVLSLPNTELQQDLKSVIKSLTALDANKPVQSGLASETQYRRFEEVQTLGEVSTSFKDAEILGQLEALLNGGCNEEDMRTAIRLFSAIERRALYHYSDPSWALSGM